MSLHAQERYETQSKILFNESKSAIAKWLSDDDVALLITLTYRSNIKSVQRVQSDMRTLNNKLRKCFYSKQALKLPKFNLGKHRSFFYTVEKTEAGCLHIHTLLTNPPYMPKEKDLSTELLKFWARITKSSNNWIEIPDERGCELYAKYSMKDQSTTQDNYYNLCWDSRY